jgi:hypothetical protein
MFAKNILRTLLQSEMIISDESDSNQSRLSKKRRVGKNYDHVEVFADKNDALKSLEAELIWSKKGPNKKTRAGKLLFFLLLENFVEYFKIKINQT